jgi:hypothetical protein
VVMVVGDAAFRSCLICATSVWPFCSALTAA